MKVKDCKIGDRFRMSILGNTADYLVLDIKDNQYLLDVGVKNKNGVINQCQFPLALHWNNLPVILLSASINIPESIDEMLEIFDSQD